MRTGSVKDHHPVHTTIMTMLWAYYALLCALCATVLYVSISHSQTATIKLTDFRKITRLLSPEIPLGDQLQRRASANVRLKTAFGIHSTFVDGNVGAHAMFVK